MILDRAWSWWWKASNEQDAIARSALTITIVVLMLLWYASRPKRRLPPGPPAWPLFGNLLGLPENLHEHFTQLSFRYGPILRVRFGAKLVIVVSSSATAREILKDQDPVFANRDVPLVAKIISYNASDIVWVPYGPTWRLVRRVCARGLLNSVSLDLRHEARRLEVRRMLARIRALSGRPVNLSEQVFICTLDSATTMLWEGTLVGEDWVKVAAEFRKLIGEITELLGVPNVSDFFPLLAPLDLQGKQRQMRNVSARFDEVFDSLIKQRVELGREKGNDFLGFLLKLKEEGDEKTPLTMNHIKGILIDLVVGGADTSSNTVEWAITEMLKKPEIMKKAQQEIGEVVGTDQQVEESHLIELPYLRAVIKEVLRLHPVLPVLVPHCPSSHCKVAGFDVPAGTRVLINVWGIHRDPEFWEEPLVFDPERFLRQPDLDFSGRDFHYIPFGSGRRMCPGTSLAERMVALILASLIHSFDWHVAEGEELETSEKFGIVLKKASPLFAIPRPRLLNSELHA